jgi:CspA family cold shock protein
MNDIVKTGIVRNFNTLRGYGFIKAPGIDADIFVHHKGIEGEGYKNLYAGDQVSFTLYENGKKGLAAKNVTVLS